jgi:hypothetical protein
VAGSRPNFIEDSPFINEAKMLAPAPAACHRPHSVALFYPIPRYLAHDGDHSSLHVRRSDQGRQGLGGRFSSRDQHDRFLEPHNCMAESKQNLFARTFISECPSLQLLIPWRFFRLWALMDGIDPPENMVRCMANNYSTLGFWRSWHRSYNLWIIR